MIDRTRSASIAEKSAGENLPPATSYYDTSIRED
jgi:hypothetical protein